MLHRTLARRTTTCSGQPVLSSLPSSKGEHCKPIVAPTDSIQDSVRVRCLGSSHAHLHSALQLHLLLAVVHAEALLMVAHKCSL